MSREQQQQQSERRKKLYTAPMVMKIGSRIFHLGLSGHSKPLITEETSKYSTSHNQPFEVQITDSFEIDANKYHIEDLKQFKTLFHSNLLTYSNTNSGENNKLINSFEYNFKIHIHDMILSQFNTLRLPITSTRLIIVCNTLFNTYYKRIITDVLFENLHVKSISFANTSLMNLIATGFSQNGIVVDFGWDWCTLEPIFDLRILNNLIRFTNVSGSKLHYHYLSCFEREIDDFENDVKNKFEFVENFIMNYAFVKVVELEHTVNQDDGKFEYMGYQLPCSLRYLPVETVLFQNKLEWSKNDDNEKSSVQLLIEMVDSLPIDIRKELINNLVLTGGLTEIPGFTQRFMNQFKDCFVNSNATTRCIKTLGGWSGASLYSGTVLFKHGQSSKTGELKRENYI